MRSPATRLVIGVLAAILGGAHIGSPDVWFEDSAGPYRMLAVIRMPKTVPGPAEVTVAVRGGDVTRVLVQPLDGSHGGANPPAEAMRPTGSGSFSARLWWMTAGSHAIRVVIEGERGRGEVLVPVTAVDGRRGPFPLGLGAFLGGLLALLLVGAVAIAAAAAREGSLPPGASPPAGRTRAVRRAGAVTAFAIVAGLSAMGAWWDAADEDFAARAYQPPPLEAAVLPVPAGHVVRVTIGSGEPPVPLLAEHGRLLHLFLLREPALDVFAHLHPVTADSVRFETSLPPLPSGRYRVVAEVVRNDGFPETMSTTLELGGRSAGTRDWSWVSGPDDAWLAIAGAGSEPEPAGARPDDRFVAADGTLFVWQGADRQRAPGKEAGLRFAVFDERGQPARLEPYMGMAGHAVVAREDGGVFVHLHPAGTVALAAMTAWQGRAESAANGTSAGVAADPPGHVVAFPYGFPSAGDYRVFVQVRREGKIATGAFTVRVRQR